MHHNFCLLCTANPTGISNHRNDTPYKPKAFNSPGAKDDTAITLIEKGWRFKPGMHAQFGKKKHATTGAEEDDVDPLNAFMADLADPQPSRAATQDHTMFKDDLELLQTAVEHLQHHRRYA